MPRVWEICPLARRSIKGVPAAPAMPRGVLLDQAAHVVEAGESQPHHAAARMEGRFPAGSLFRRPAEERAFARPTPCTACPAPWDDRARGAPIQA
jgi:hypothetical protein